jgi:hypothetical protein
MCYPPGAECPTFGLVNSSGLIIKNQRFETFNFHTVHNCNTNKYNYGTKFKDRGSFKPL